MSDRLASALARRIAHVLGISTLALPAFAPAGCGGKVVLDGGAGGSSSTSGGGGGAAPACIVGPKCAPLGPGPGPMQSLCFSPEGGPCPDAAQALPLIPGGCASVTSVQAACSGGTAGMCCYNVTAECICTGRPFLVDGAPRTATALPGEDRGWRGEGATVATDLPQATREALAAAFTEDALGEHASIASFARFALELMAVGAPADLVAAAHEAALDEVRHAQIAFGLASAFGSCVGPGALPCATPALRTDLASFARAVAVEGCVHETLASLVASARAEAATEVRLKTLLSSIAEDEARHAELAWRTLAWALRAGGEAVAEAVSAAFAGAVRDVLAASLSGRARSSMDLRAFGVLDAGATRAVIAAGIAGVIEPCARALLAERPTSGREVSEEAGGGLWHGEVAGLALHGVATRDACWTGKGEGLLYTFSRAFTKAPGDGPPLDADERRVYGTMYEQVEQFRRLRGDMAVKDIEEIKRLSREGFRHLFTGTPEEIAKMLGPAGLVAAIDALPEQAREEIKRHLLVEDAPAPRPKKRPR